MTAAADTAAAAGKGGKPEPTIAERVGALEALGGKIDALVVAMTKANEIPDEHRKGGPFPDADKKVVNQNGKWPRGDEGKFSISKFCAAVLGVKELGFDRSWDRFPYEKQVMEAAYAEQKAMGEATSSAGGYLVPPQYITELIEIVRAKSITQTLGVRRIPTNSNTGFIPRQTAATTASWLGEGATITASDMTFDQLAFTIRKLAAYAILSNELIADANPAADALTRDDLSAAIALKEDFTILYGTGTPPEPRGVKNATGVTLTSLGANGATPTFDNLIDLEANLRVNNRQLTGTAAAPRTTTTLRKIKDTTNRYIWEPTPYTGYVMPSITATSAPPPTRDGSVQASRPVGTLLSAPYAESTQIPTNLTQGMAANASDIFMGQWDEVVVIEKGGLELAASDQILFQNYQTAIRAIVRRDVLVRHGSAFAVAIGVLP